MARKVLKVSVVIVNVLVLILGIIIAALGIWVLTINNDIVKLSKIRSNGYYSSTFEEPDLLQSAAVICIVVGVAMILVASLTFHGIRKEHKCFMAICAAILATIIIMDIIVIILTSVTKQQTDNKLRTALIEGVQSHYDSIIASEFDFSVNFDRVQVQLECCGVNNYTDFHDIASKWTDRTKLKIPLTCCIMNSKSAYLNENKYDLKVATCAINLDTFNQQPCYSIIKDWVTEKSFVLLAVSVVIACAKLVAVILDIVFLRIIKQDTPYNDI